MRGSSVCCSQTNIQLVVTGGVTCLQLRCWLIKSRGEADFSDCWECLRHNFFSSSGALLRLPFMRKMTAVAYIFSPPVSSPPPENTIFLEMELLYFTSMHIHLRRLCSQRRTTPSPAFIYLFRSPPTHSRTRAHVHSTSLINPFFCFSLFVRSRRTS